MIGKTKYKPAVETIQERLDKVRERIAGACQRAGRDAAEVQLIAVSKTHGPEVVREAAECGLTIFGENKIQEAAAKIPECPGHLTWHLVGHLQRNKAGRAAELFDMIHSVDSIRLLETIDHAGGELGKTIKVLLEVNMSGEASKYGLSPGEVAGVLGAADALAHVDVRGLMTMPPFADEPEKARQHFRALRKLRDELKLQSSFSLNDLSMGMSHDFEVAIEEGANWIRVGTALFGARASMMKAV